MSQWILLDFVCPEHGKFESLVLRKDRAHTACPNCSEPAKAVDSYAVFGRLKMGEVSQGKRHTADLPPWVMRTEQLADGMDPGEWRKKEQKRLEDLTRPKKSRKIISS